MNSTRAIICNERGSLGAPPRSSGSELAQRLFVSNSERTRAPGYIHRCRDAFTMLFFWSSFLTCAQAWEVLFRGYLQSYLLTLFPYLCFLQSLCFGGMWRRLSPYANRFFPSPPSLR